MSKKSHLPVIDHHSDGIDLLCPRNILAVAASAAVDPMTSAESVSSSSSSLSSSSPMSVPVSDEGCPPSLTDSTQSSDDSSLSDAPLLVAAEVGGAADSVPFEGVEKRLVVFLKPECPIKLLSFSVAQWQAILNHACCTIVSSCQLSSEDESTSASSESGGDDLVKSEHSSPKGRTKVYLLSESTLTVWADGFLLKTCGRTLPLLALTAMMKTYGAAFESNIELCLFSRLDFLHPQYQFWPHQSFQQEEAYLTETFSGQKVDCFELAVRGGSTLYVGCYENGARGKALILEEALMLGVGSDCVRSLAGFDTLSEQSDLDKGQEDVGVLRPFLSEHHHNLDEFWFDPFGYSCNGLLEQRSNRSLDYFSIHVSPEPETSFASFEFGTAGSERSLHAADLFGAVVPAFGARRLHHTVVHSGLMTTPPLLNPKGFLLSDFCQRRCGSVTVSHYYYTSLVT